MPLYCTTINHDMIIFVSVAKKRPYLFPLRTNSREEEKKIVLCIVLLASFSRNRDGNEFIPMGITHACPHPLEFQNFFYSRRNSYLLRFYKECHFGQRHCLQKITLTVIFCYKIQSIYVFMKLYFEMNLLISLLYFETQPKRSYLQSKFKMFDLR